MRTALSKEVEDGRMLFGYYGSPPNSGPYGAFKFKTESGEMVIIACGAEEKAAHGWEHVSVSFTDRCPTWEEMCKVKDMFWEPEECVIQLHPPQSLYINAHPYALHLWRNTKTEFHLPPSIFVA